MTIERLSGTHLQYYLIAFDGQGNERPDDPDGLGPHGLMSQRVLDALTTSPVTDVFLICHGWQGDIPAAREQYNNWIAAMARCTSDIQRIQKTQSAFHPLLVGLHWPSKPWGNEDFNSATSFDPASAPTPVVEFIDQYIQRLIDTPTTRAALTTIFSAAQIDYFPTTLPPQVSDAYNQLNKELGIGSGGVGAAPGADREGFDPDGIFETAQEQSFDIEGFNLGGLLAPLRVMSFWRMKDRARQLGETAGFQLLSALQRAPRKQRMYFHLMGHSFGCIVVSAMLGGLGGRSPLTHPVDSVTLVQGALSLWSYTKEIPLVRGQSGYFNALISDKKVAGPIITTQSEFDYAVGRFYPLGAGIMQQVSFAPGELPRYGGVGTFGIQGPHLDIVEMKMLPLEGTYEFEASKIYNLDGSQYICQRNGSSGAHNDIAHSEVAHAVWSAVRLGK